MTTVISYQTEQLPPPYAYACTLCMHVQDERVLVDFEMVYLNRSSLSVNEIEAEGFSADDDWNWKGSLGSAWIHEIAQCDHWNYTTEPCGENYIHVLVQETERGFPTDIEKAEMLVQSLIQAVMESAGYAPELSIQVSDQNNQEYTLSWSFKNRLTSISIDQTEGKTIEWEESLRLMQVLYSEEVTSKKPNKKRMANAVCFEKNGGWFSVPQNILP